MKYSPSSRDALNAHCREVIRSCLNIVEQHGDTYVAIHKDDEIDSVTGWHSVFLADDSMIYMFRQCLWLSMNLTYEDLLAMLKECISEYKRGKGRLTTGDHPTNPVA